MEASSTRVWTKLWIDNAIDAIGEQGRFGYAPGEQAGAVEIIDNGHPGELQSASSSRSLLPLREKGEGTGLGLVTSYRTAVGHQAISASFLSRGHSSSPACGPSIRS